jgi:hypothetical protein
MLTPPDADVPMVRASEVDLAGSGKPLQSAVGRRQQQDDKSPSGMETSQIVASIKAARAIGSHCCVVTEHLFDSRSNERTVHRGPEPIAQDGARMPGITLLIRPAVVAFSKMRRGMKTNIISLYELGQSPAR